MIDIRELHNEQESIADQIIKTIHGESETIPYFTYHGPYKDREWIMRGRRGVYIFTVTESVNMSWDAKNVNFVSQGENGVLTRIQKSSGYSPEA